MIPSDCSTGDCKSKLKGQDVTAGAKQKAEGVPVLWAAW